MGIKRIVSRQEAEAILANADKDAGLVKEIIQKLKENPDSLIEVDAGDLKRLRNKISYLKKHGIDNDVNHLRVRTAKADDNQPIALVDWLVEAPQPVVRKKKAKKPEQNDTQNKQ